MKNLIYTLSLLVLVSACTSINKLVEKGEYERAFALGVKKLQGKKNKKTKYVKGIETAFRKMMTRDMNHVSNLMTKDNPKYWDEIYETYRAIDKRQATLEPLLPLISKDGYRAKFKFIKTATLEKTASENASSFYYEKGMSYMNGARNGQKKDARRAYNSFDRIGKYNDNYKDANNLMKECYDLGQTRILVSLSNRSQSILPVRFEQELFNFGVRNLDNRWHKFYSNADDKIDYDMIATYFIELIDVSPEREHVDHVVEKKEIADGWEYQLDSNGNVVKDTSGNDIKVEVFKTISAEVAHVVMEKSVRIDGRLHIKNIRNNKIILNKSLSGKAVFDEHFSTFRGNKKALSKETKRKLKHGDIYFPSDEDLLLSTSDELKDEISRELRRMFK